jgi:hypothetical protein
MNFVSLAQSFEQSLSLNTVAKSGLPGNTFTQLLGLGCACMSVIFFAYSIRAKCGKLQCIINGEAGDCSEAKEGRQSGVPG